MTLLVKRIITLSILGAGVAMGALHDFVFINLRFQEDFLRRGRPLSYAHSMFQAWVRDLDLKELHVLRWVLAVGFAAAMLALAVALARLLFGSHRYRGAIVMGYLIIGVLALGCYMGASILPPLAPVGTKLLHALQFPLVLVFIWGAAWLAPRSGPTGSDPSGGR